MIGAASRSPSRRLGAVGLVAVALPGLALAVGSRLGPLAGLAALAVGLGGSIALRFTRASWGRDVAPLPILGGLGLLVFASPLTLFAELLAGVAGVAVLVWAADDPDRLPGGVVRGASVALLPAGAVAVAWASVLLLPAGVASLGIGAGLIAAVLGAIAFLAGRPDAFDREEGATS